MCNYCEHEFLNKDLAQEGTFLFNRRMALSPSENGIIKLKYQEVNDDQDWEDGTELEVIINYCPMCGRQLNTIEPKTYDEVISREG